LGRRNAAAHPKRNPSIQQYMMCGAVLSRLDRGTHFDLSTPVLVDPLEVATPQATSRAFDIGDGEVAVFLHVDD